jgi:serine/threonine protein kinase
MDKENWNESVANGRKIGEGSYGTVLTAGQNKVHKRGEIGEFEADILKKVGAADLGPRLLVAEMAAPKSEQYGMKMADGRIAMTKVEGKPIGSAKADAQFAGKNAADIYWKTMADLHRMGIAHNDAHIDNILIDKNGKGRWVDMGLAQMSPKAALAEAMGIFDTLKGAPATRVAGAYGQGNWQTRRWDGTGVKAAERAKQGGTKTWTEFMERFPVASRVWENRPAAQYALIKMGLSKNDVSSIIDHGIRSTPESYTKGPWAKLTDKQALEILNILYDGI